MEKKLKMRQELEAKILEEENKKMMLDDQLNNFQLEEIKIIQRIQNNEENESSNLNENQEKRASTFAVRGSISNSYTK